MLQRLPLLITLLFGLTLAGAIAWQLKPLVAPPVVAIEEPEVALQTQAGRPTESGRNIAAFMLFGDAQEQPKTTPQASEKLPETQLRLTLTGVVSSDTQAETGAMIEGPDRETLYYRLGDTLPGNATLKEVFADRVIVERSGRLENLYFPQSTTEGISTYMEPPPSVVDDQPSDYVEEPSITTENSDGTEEAVPNDTESIANARKQSIRDRLSKLRKRISGADE